jgi:hypothetical protein
VSFVCGGGRKETSTKKEKKKFEETSRATVSRDGLADEEMYTPKKM